MFQVFVDPLHSAGNNNNTGNRATCFHLSIALKTRSSNSLITCIFQRLIIFTCYFTYTTKVFLSQGFDIKEFFVVLQIYVMFGT